MLLAKKKNMTQMFDEKNNVVPVTILDYSECFVIKGQKKSGTFIGIGKKGHPNKAEIGKYGDTNVPSFSMPVDEAIEEIDSLTAGDVVTVSGTSKGHGFAGVVRMWGFKGGKRTHGQSDRERHPGSIGAGTTMGRVLKGMHMGRNKGNETVTIRGVEIVSNDTENKLLCVRGSIPGSYNSVLVIKRK
jgi:large subunit ribosomal protein L3